MNGVPEIVNEFARLAKDFDAREFVGMVKVDQTVDEYRETNDPALRQALMESGVAVLATPGIKRRHQDAACKKGTLCAIDGYSIGRCIFGTWRRPVSYTSDPTKQDENRNRIREQGQTYAWESLMGALEGEALWAFTGMTDVVQGTALDRILGHRNGQAVRMTMMMEGLRLALAEEELFDLRAQVQA